MLLFSDVVLTFLVLSNVVTAFFPPAVLRITNSQYLTTTSLWSGKGVAPDYTWQEEAFEIEVTVKVPKETRANDILFKASPTSIDLRLKASKPDDHVVLLDPSRPLRGKVVLDGTFWVIGDPEIAEKNDKDEEPYRVVTVTIEKQIRTPQDDFDIVDYDWKGVYTNDEEEVSYRKYDEPEELNVREYAASLGVDINNLNMSMVDKTMFTSGLNTSKSSFDSLREAGLMKEVTRQGDGSEWTTDESGEQVPFSSMGRAVSSDELRTSDNEVGLEKRKAVDRPKIPFIDTDSPWNNAIPVKDAEFFSKDHLETERSATKEDLEPLATTETDQEEDEQDTIDPISALTVVRLKEILKSRGLKVSGSKRELQDRLRAEIQNMLTSNDESYDETMQD
jgi:hypothetical protein